MGWFWADTANSSQASYIQASGHRRHDITLDVAVFGEDLAPTPGSSEGGCPYSGFTSLAPSAEAAVPSADSPSSRLNPLNRMPMAISQSRSDIQTIDLPTDRSISTIPKGSDHHDGRWVYPSPQQMYNALLRKGYTDTPQEAMEEMVAVHNFLNEGAWAEIIEWERRFAGGLAQGWRECRRGESASKYGANMLNHTELGGEKEETAQPRLLKFEGRPKDLTPKASLVQLLGWLYPSAFGCEAPFDRHDWYIQRQTPSHRTAEVRYVIDYYSAPPEPPRPSSSSSSPSSSSTEPSNDHNPSSDGGGETVFYLDVRPAVDSPRAAAERLIRWGGDVWWRMSGGVLREDPLASTTRKA